MTKLLSHAQFYVIDADSMYPSVKHYRWTNVEVRIRCQEDLFTPAMEWPAWCSRHVTAIWYREMPPKAYQQITLHVRMPVVARWSTGYRWAAIRRRVISKLDNSGIDYDIVQVEYYGLVYLPKNIKPETRILVHISNQPGP